MKIFKILCLVLVFPLVTSATLHKFYVSVTQVDYVKEKQSVQIISRIFIDDFEKLLQTRYDKNISLDSDKETPEVQLYMERYLKEKIHIKINGKPVTFDFIGKEYEDDIVLCYLEIDDVTNIKSFEIENQVLFDMFEDQQNVIKTNINTQNKSFMLTPDNDKGMLNF